MTVFDWLGTDSQFAEQYLAARRAGCEAMVDDGIVIVDNSHNDTEWCVDEETGELHKIVDHEARAAVTAACDYRNGMWRSSCPGSTVSAWRSSTRATSS